MSVLQLCWCIEHWWPSAGACVTTVLVPVLQLCWCWCYNCAGACVYNCAGAGATTVLLPDLCATTVLVPDLCVTTVLVHRSLVAKVLVPACATTVTVVGIPEWSAVCINSQNVWNTDVTLLTNYQIYKLCFCVCVCIFTGQKHPSEINHTTLLKSIPLKYPMNSQQSPIILIRETTLPT